MKLCTAYHNVCFSPEHVTLAELKRFTADTQPKVAAKVDIQTLDWIWERLAETGPAGDKYVQKFGPVYREQVAAQQ